MYSILIGLGITILATVLVARRYQTSSSSSWRDFGILYICVIPFISTLIVSTSAELFYVPYRVIQTSETRADIVALKDNTLIEGKISGSIFIVSGYIKGEPIYFYYRQEGTGFVQDHLKATGVVIYEDTENKGYILTYTVVEKADEAWKKKYLHWLVFKDIKSRTTTSEIHVPKGTIVRDFVLDAE